VLSIQPTGYGAAKARKFTKTDINRMIHQLLHEGIITETSEVTGTGPTGFPITVHKLHPGTSRTLVLSLLYRLTFVNGTRVNTGPNEHKFMASSTRRITMQFRKKTTKDTSKAPAKRGRKAAAASLSMVATDDAKEQKTSSSWRQTKIKAKTIDEFDDQESILQPLYAPVVEEPEPEYVVIDGDEPSPTPPSAPAAASVASKSNAKSKTRLNEEQVEALSTLLDAARFAVLSCLSLIEY
jgi:hypothetical protein